MSDPIHTALLFLINTLFDLYLFILVIRVILVWVRADFFNPITQFITKLTSVIVNPSRKVLPNMGRLETATLILVILLEMIKFFLIASLTFGIPNILGVFILAFADTLSIFLNTFFYAILLSVILSWVQLYSPVTKLINQMVAPIMRPIQRVFPPVGGFDLSPIPALIGLQLLIILVVAPLMTVGMNLALG